MEGELRIIPQHTKRSVMNCKLSKFPQCRTRLCGAPRTGTRTFLRLAKLLCKRYLAVPAASTQTESFEMGFYFLVWLESHDSWHVFFLCMSLCVWVLIYIIVKHYLLYIFLFYCNEKILTMSFAVMTWLTSYWRRLKKWKSCNPSWNAILPRNQEIHN